MDPLTGSYPWYTPYQFAGNKPILAIDLDGLEELPVTSNVQGEYSGVTIHSVTRSEKLAAEIQKSRFMGIRTIKLKEIFAKVGLIGGTGFKMAGKDGNGPGTPEKSAQISKDKMGGDGVNVVSFGSLDYKDTGTFSVYGFKINDKGDYEKYLIGEFSSSELIDIPGGISFSAEGAYLEGSNESGGSDQILEANKWDSGVPASSELDGLKLLYESIIKIEDEELENVDSTTFIRSSDSDFVDPDTVTKYKRNNGTFSQKVKHGKYNRKK